MVAVHEILDDLKQQSQIFYETNFEKYTYPSKLIADYNNAPVDFLRRL